MQRASYESSAPTWIVSPLNGAGRPSTSRCVRVAVPPQQWQTAWSLSTSSAIASRVDAEDTLAGDLGATHTADQLLALPTEHRAQTNSSQPPRSGAFRI